MCCSHLGGRRRTDSLASCAAARGREEGGSPDSSAAACVWEGGGGSSACSLLLLTHEGRGVLAPGGRGLTSSASHHGNITIVEKKVAVPTNLANQTKTNLARLR